MKKILIISAVSTSIISAAAVLTLTGYIYKKATVDLEDMIVNVP